MPAADSAGLTPSRRILLLLAALWIGSFWHFAQPTGVLGRLPFIVFAFNVVVSLAGLGAVYVLAAGDAATRRLRQLRVLAAALATGLTLATCELPVVLGWLDYRTVLQFDPSQSLLNPSYRIDRELIGLRHPHDRFVGEVAGDLVHRLQIDTDRRYPVDVRWDHHGFRNATDLTAADVVLIGDSYLEAALVPWEETIAARLTRALDRPVLNLGHSGYGPQQELVVLRRYGFPAKPRVAVWFFYEGNDLLNCLTYQGVQQQWDDWLAREHGLFSRSFLRNGGNAAARLLSRPPRDPAVAASRQGLLKVPGDWHGAAMYFGYRCPPQTDYERQGLRITRDVLQDAARDCQARGIRLVVAFVPAKWRVYAPLIEIEDGAELLQWEVTDLNRRLLDGIEDAEAIEYVDLTEPLAAAARNGELVYALDDAHWTAAGHAVVAERLRAVIGTQDVEQPTGESGEGTVDGFVE